jgi:hypothetical protein
VTVVADKGIKTRIDDNKPLILDSNEGVVGASSTINPIFESYNLY